VDNAAAATPTDDTALLRAFEPVVRLTQGEYFLPVGVEDYVRRCSVWEQDADGKARHVAEPGSIDLERLAELGAAYAGPGQSLSGISLPSSRWRRVRRRRTPRPRFRGGARLAQVGLLGRTIDTLSRFSLLLRGAVPGGSAGLSFDLQNEHLHPERPTYHARVVRDGDWIVCQYWFFYSFNNWRSAFSGVNEHESDWEQVTIYLDATELADDGWPAARWVVFSAHDETGDDLRRRWDDPDLTLVERRHPVVFAGAGSHSGAYLAGDYLITVVPPTLGGVVPAVRRLAQLVTPWSRAAQGSGFGIPYIDYARGDGPSIGPGQPLTWTPVVIDDDTPWVRDYRGLWGHDTRDRLGGERGPAGPRYDRDGTVRASWGDPVGWAGLAKVAPNPRVEQALITRRIAQLDTDLAAIDERASESRVSLASAAAGLPPAAPSVRALDADERALTADRLTAVRLRDERERLQRAQRDGVPQADPHAHLHHRRTPIEPIDRGRSRFLRWWAVVSTPLVLWFLGSIVRPGDQVRWQLALAALVIVLSVEAFARGYFLAFLGRVVLVSVAAYLVVEFAQNWQVVTGLALSAVAVLVLVVNIRDAVRR
jgi:hypothetical protein